MLTLSPVTLLLHRTSFGASHERRDLICVSTPYTVGLSDIQCVEVDKGRDMGPDIGPVSVRVKGPGRGQGAALLLLGAIFCQPEKAARQRRTRHQDAEGRG